MDDTSAGAPLLAAMGLPPATELVYRLLLERPGWGVANLTTHLGWPETAVREAFDELMRLRLMQSAGDEPGAVRPVSPASGLASLLTGTEIELVRRQREIEVTRAAVAEFTARYLPRRDYLVDVVERIEGIDAVRARLGELAQLAQRECLSLLPGGPQQPDTMDASKPLDQQALERGVVIRNIYQDSVRNSSSTIEYVEWFAALGGEVRTVPALPMLMVVVDSAIALVPADPDDARAGALELRGLGAVSAMRALFEQFWAVGVEWGRSTPLDERGLSPQELALLEILAEGSTDQSAAHQLGVSLRTVRRMVSDLSARLGARSRFEAGVLAARCGWL